MFLFLSYCSISVCLCVPFLLDFFLFWFFLIPLFLFLSLVVCFSLFHSLRSGMGIGFAFSAVASEQDRKIIYDKITAEGEAIMELACLFLFLSFVFYFNSPIQEKPKEDIRT